MAKKKETKKSNETSALGTIIDMANRCLSNPTVQAEGRKLINKVLGKRGIKVSDEQIDEAGNALSGIVNKKK